MQNRHNFVAWMPVFVGAVATFLGAFLLFFIQPLWGRQLVMAFGGVSTVWNTLLFVFQTILCVGYGLVFLMQYTKYQHFLMGAVVVGAVVQLLAPLPPVYVENPITFTGLISQFYGILLPVLGLTLATPFVQKQLAAMASQNRYELYSFSNIGSFTALILTPLVLLPLFEQDQLLNVWRVGTALFLGLILYFQLAAPKVTPQKYTGLTHPKWVTWLIWPFLTTCLLHAFSQYLSNEIANLPLVWVVPLGGFLLSYVIAFTGILKRSVLALLAAVTCLAIVAAASLFGDKGWLVFGLHLVAFLGACLYSHGRLYQARPNVQHMPLFYLYIAFAGMMAGLINAQLLPLVLPDMYEYPAYYVLFLGLVMATYTRQHQGLIWPLSGGLIGFAVLGVMALNIPNTLAQWRNYYGVMKVTKEGDLHVYYNNGTAHEFQDMTLKAPATAQYLKSIISATPYQAGRVAVIGMGPGNTACYTQPSQAVDFYEINPLVAELAADEALFTFSRDCAREGEVVFGDGRVAFPHEEGQPYDVIVNTAHAGLTLPTHLVTKEAFQHYAQSLTADGVMLTIVPSLYFNYHNALVTTARAAGFQVYFAPMWLLNINEEYPYSWYAFYKSNKAEEILMNAQGSIWQPARIFEGRCSVLTDQHYSFLQLAGFWGENCEKSVF